LSDQHQFEMTTDAQAVAALRAAAEGGEPEAKRKSVVRLMKHGRCYAMTNGGGGLMATFCLTEKKPWAIDAAYFTVVGRPLYLVAMAVEPKHQRRGLGRRCLAAAETIASDWPADAFGWIRTIGLAEPADFTNVRGIGKSAGRATGKRRWSITSGCWGE